MVDLEQVTNLGQLAGPLPVGTSLTKKCFHVGSRPTGDGLDMGNGLAVTNDGEVFPAVFDRVEEIRETSCGIGGAHFQH